MTCPSPPGSLHGNRTTALRWARILRGLGHRVTVKQDYTGEPCAVLIALHARRSAESVVRFHEQHPEKPIIVVLTGTDLYQDIRSDREAQQAMELASRLVVLQPLGIEELAPRLRGKVRVILQSAERTRGRIARSTETFDVCVVGHLREVKDPFRTAFAARRLPPASQIRVLHAGSARERELAEMAQGEEKRNARYRWLGAIPRRRVRRLIAASRLMVLSSRMEGGANVISEAVVDRTPVLASRIPGSVGLLGEGYPGYFPVGDTRALAHLLETAEANPVFYAELKSWCSKLAPKFHPSREKTAWKRLLAEIRG